MNTQQKYLLFAGALIVVAAIGMVIVIASTINSSPSPTTTTTYTTPDYTPTPISPSNAQTINTQQGTVTVVNPADTTISSDNSVPQAPSKNLANTDDYNITYFGADNSFAILLQSTPFAKARMLAETAFLKTLNISKTDACKLSVAEQVPYNLSQDQAGINFHLSFCADALPLN